MQTVLDLFGQISGSVDFSRSVAMLLEFDVGIVRSRIREIVHFKQRLVFVSIEVLWCLPHGLAAFVLLQRAFNLRDVDLAS